MVGAVLMAISGATQLFSITWAAAIPPDPRLAPAQRWTMATGAVATITGVTWKWNWLTLAGAALVGMGLVGLAAILVGVTRRSLVKRFGLSSRFDLLAMSAGMVGVTLGAVVGVGSAGSRYLDFRVAHMHLNLVGLVGLTIVGTLPALLPTVAHHKMVSDREAVAAFWFSVAAVISMASGAVLGPTAVGIGCGLASVGAALTLLGIVTRLGLRRIASSGVPGLLLTSGFLWLIGWMAAEFFTLVYGEHTLWSWTTGMGVGGVALVLFGSLSYLIPVLAGPGSDLAGNFERMRSNHWIRFALANGTVVSVVAGVTGWIVLIMGATLVVDFGARVMLVVTRGRRRAD